MKIFYRKILLFASVMCWPLGIINVQASDTAPKVSYFGLSVFGRFVGLFSAPTPFKGFDTKKDAQIAPVVPASISEKPAQTALVTPSFGNQFPKIIGYFQQSPSKFAYSKPAFSPSIGLNPFVSLKDAWKNILTPKSIRKPLDASYFKNRLNVNVQKLNEADALITQLTNHETYLNSRLNTALQEKDTLTNEKDGLKARILKTNLRLLDMECKLTAACKRRDHLMAENTLLRETQTEDKQLLQSKIDCYQQKIAQQNVELQQSNTLNRDLLSSLLTGELQAMENISGGFEYCSRRKFKNIHGKEVCLEITPTYEEWEEISKCKDKKREDVTLERDGLIAKAIDYSRQLQQKQIGLDTLTSAKEVLSRENETLKSKLKTEQQNIAQKNALFKLNAQALQLKLQEAKTIQQSFKDETKRNLDSFKKEEFSRFKTSLLKACSANQAYQNALQKDLQTTNQRLNDACLAVIATEGALHKEHGKNAELVKQLEASKDNTKQAEEMYTNACRREASLATEKKEMQEEFDAKLHEYDQKVKEVERRNRQLQSTIDSLTTSLNDVSLSLKTEHELQLKSRDVQIKQLQKQIADHEKELESNTTLLTKIHTEHEEKINALKMEIEQRFFVQEARNAGIHERITSTGATRFGDASTENSQVNFDSMSNPS